MAGDISSYALSVEFQLADKFTPTLNLAEERLTRIEEQVSNIAAKGMVQFQQAAAQIETSVSQIAIQYNKIHDLNMQLLKPAKEQQTFGMLQQRRLLDEAVILKDKMFAQWLEINKVLGVKQELLDAERKTLDAEAVQVEQIGTGIGFWVDQINKANGTLRSYLRSLVDVNNHIKLATAANAKFQQTAAQTAASGSQIADQYQMIRDLSKLIVKPVGEQQAHDLQHQRRLQAELGILKDRMLPQWSLINERLVEKQKLLDVESHTLDDEVGKSKQVGKSIGHWEEQVNKALRALKDFSRELLDVVGHFKLAADASERFHHANLRLVGTQSEMAQQAQELAVRHGLYREAVLEAYQALGDVKVPQEAFAKLAVASAQFSRLSGVSVKETVTWQKSLLAAGVTAAEVERRTGDLALAMRKFGLSSRDVNGIMADQEQTMTRLANNFGPMAQVLQRSQVATAAFAKQLNATESEIAAISQAWTRLDSTAFERIRGQAALLRVQRDINTVEGQQELLARAAIKYARERLPLERQMREAMARSAELSRIANRTAEQQLELEQAQMRASNASRQLRMLENRAIADYMPVMGQAVNTLSRLTAAKLAEGKTEEEILELSLNSAKRQGDAQTNLARIHAESNETFAAQLQLLRSAFQDLGAVFNSIEPDLVAVMKVINAVAHSVINFILRINNALTALGAFGRAIRIAIIVAVVLIVAFGGLSAILAVFGGAARLATGAGRAMGATLEYTLKGLARGLKALAAYVPTMLALAALMLAVGAAAYLLALAVAMIAQQGTAGVKALAALTAAIIALGVGLAFAGVIAGGVWPALLALAAVLLAAGAAAYLFALAVSMIAGLGRRAIGALLMLAATLVLVGLAIAFTGALVMPVIPGVLAIAAAVLLFALAALFLAYAIKIAVQSLQLLNADLGKNVAAFAWELLKAAPILILAGILLIVGAAAVLVGAVALAVASLVLLVAGAVLTMGAALIFASGTMLAVGTALIAIGGVSLIVGAAALLVGSAILIPAAIALTLAAIALTIGAALLLPGAVLLAVAGVLIAIGGLGLLAGAAGLYYGVPLLLQAVKLMWLAGIGLTIGAGLLLPGAVILAAAGLAILVGGLALLAGALAVFVGSMLLAASGALLLFAGVGIAAGALLLSAGVALLVPASALLIGAGVLMAIAGALVLPGAILLAVAGILILIAGLGVLLGGLALWGGAKFLLWGALALIEAAPKISQGSLALIPASIALMAGAALLLVASIVLLVAGALFLFAGASLLAGALLFTVAMFILEPGADLLSELAAPFLAASIQLMLTGLFIFLGGSFLLVGGVLMLAAAAVLVLVGPALWFASWSTEKGLKAMLQSGQWANEVGVGFQMGGTGLYQGGLMMSMAGDILIAAGRHLHDIADELATNLESLGRAAWAAAQIGPPISAAGAALYSGGLNLSWGASFLQSAVKQLRDPARELEGIAGVLTPTLTGLATALNDVASKLATSLEALATATQAAEQIGPALGAVGRALYSGSFGLLGGALFLRSAVNQLRGPARELEGIAGALVPILTNLAAALATPIDRLFYTVTSEVAASAQALYSTLDSVVFVLTIYADRLEAVANRIATSLRRAAPALSLSLFGLTPIRAETIVTPAAPSRTRQADEEMARQEYLREVRNQSQKLDAIKDKLEEIRVVVNGMGGKGPGAPLGEILELLRTHLPEIASGSGGIGSRGLQAPMTDWMR